MFFSFKVNTFYASDLNTQNTIILFHLFEDDSSYVLPIYSRDIETLENTM